MLTESARRRSMEEAKFAPLPSQPKPPELPLPIQPKQPELPLPSQPKPELTSLPSQPKPLWELLPIPRLPPNQELEPVRQVDVTDSDLESEDKVWALYERWCRVCGVERTPEEKEQRFETFKKNATFVRKLNKKYYPECEFCLDSRCDLPDKPELQNQPRQIRISRRKLRIRGLALRIRGLA